MALGGILVRNSQKPGLHGRIHIHGSNGPSVGAQTEVGAPFVSGITTVVEPSFNAIWNIPGEEHLLSIWQAEDRRAASEGDVVTY